MTASELQGLAAIVTGGATGIGLATAETLAARGARVAVLDQAPGRAPGHVHALAADMADDTSVRWAVGRAVEDLGGLDILVNNAGTGAVGTVEENPDGEWRRVLEINLLGVVRASRAALPFLRRSPYASIVNISSVTATAGLPARRCTRRARAPSSRSPWRWPPTTWRRASGSTASPPAPSTRPGWNG